jgi:cell division protein FtsB
VSIQPKRILYFLALGLGIGFIAYTLVGPGGGSKQAHIQSELEKLRLENEQLKEKNRRLTLDAEALKTRQDYIEKVSRDDLGLVRKDEIVLTGPSDNPNPPIAPRGVAPDGGPPAGKKTD